MRALQGAGNSSGNAGGASFFGISGDMRSDALGDHRAEMPSLQRASTFDLLPPIRAV